MKKAIVILACLLTVLGVGAAVEYHDFLDTQGRSMRGRVLRYDVKKQLVTIERDNRAVATVPLGIFSDEDQEYVRAWEFNKIFLSKSSFKISAKRKKIKDKDDSYSGSVHAKKVENMGYEILLENRSASKIENLKIAYCVYYEQEKATRGKQLCEQGVRYGSLDVEYMLPKSKKELQTEAVRIYKTELDADWIYTSGTKNVQRGKVHGIWIRAYMKQPLGKKLTRSYCLPDSLSNSRAWKSSNVNVGMNKSRKKNNRN